MTAPDTTKKHNKDATITVQLRADSGYECDTEARISPAQWGRISAILAGNDQAKPVQNEWRDVLEAVLREMPAHKGIGGNAPGHSHAIPGVWDGDNGLLSGKPCAWCLTWNKAKRMLAVAPTN